MSRGSETKDTAWLFVEFVRHEVEVGSRNDITYSFDRRMV
jgi:hypothetical protein